MLVIDFLQLIADLRKKTTFYYRTDERNWPLQFVKADAASPDQPRLLLTTTTGTKTLQQWELLFLLNQPAYYQRPIFVRHQGEELPVFGFRMVNQQAWLH